MSAGVFKIENHKTNVERRDFALKDSVLKLSLRHKVKGTLRVSLGLTSGAVANS